MHKHHSWLLMLALAVALMMAAPVFAQTTPLDIGEGYSVTIPDSWIRAGRLNGGFAFISQNTSSVIYGPEAMQDLTRAGTRGTPRTALAAVYRTLYEEPMDTTGIYNQKIDGRDAAVWYYIMGTRQEGIFVVITLDERMTYMGIDITTPVNESGPAEDQIEAIVASLTSEGTAASSTSDSADASGEPCFVSTDAADTARLRVGPGFNRTSVAFLPAG
ncbi:MAG: hypothetical protein KC519_16550, partial [Anaerolineae bacterium]|nr:hypothetical protein [Anaerolineae bacterium]